MIVKVIEKIKTATLMLVFMTILTGIIYPLFITLVAHLLFPYQANGSLIQSNGNIMGSALIGQYFDRPHYFWGRPSATSRVPYNGERSGGSNMGPSNPKHIDSVRDRITYLMKTDPQAQSMVPIDLVTASGSGLDPDISPLSALYQVPRIATERGVPEEMLVELIRKLTKPREFGVLGEPRINVLELNLALDRSYGNKK